MSRKVNLSGYTLVYFNNDIQYGSKYILKRITDIILSSLLTIIFLPIFILISLYIFYLDKTPIIIKQDRVGLHGEIFKMYKFRTMKNNSHEEREKLKDMSKKSGPLFKISDDPRLIKVLNL